MTVGDLKKIGIIHVGSKREPNTFFIPYAGEVNLYPPYSWEVIYQSVYDAGRRDGEEVGAMKKTAEIKRVLNISDE